MALDPVKAEERLKAALMECRNKNFEKGKSMLQDLIKDDPENYKAYNALGKVLVLQKDTETAVDMFEKASKIRPDFTESVINLAQTLYKLGEYPEAKIYYQRIVETESKNADGHFGLANVYRKQESYKDAIREYNVALNLNPRDAQAYVNLGLCHYKDENYNDAVYNFKMALELGGDRMKAFMNLALSLEKLDRYSEACENWERFIDMEPKGSELDLAIEHLAICKTKY